MGEITTIEDLDDESSAEKSLVVHYEWPIDGRGTKDAIVSLPPVEPHTNFGQYFVAHVPCLQARLSVASPQDVAFAADAFINKDGFYFFQARYRQTGWWPDEQFGFPGVDDPLKKLDACHLTGLAGFSLLSFPQVPEFAQAQRGAHTLLEIVRCAPVDVGAPLLGTLVGAPIFRRDSQLGARGFTTLLVNPTQAGKTMLVSSLYCLFGKFYLKPWSLETWFSSAATLEQAMHFFRDLPLFVDDYRHTDRKHRETFRSIAMFVGNSAAKGRSSSRRGGGGLRVARRFRPQCLVIATGEHSPEDDGGEEARVIEVRAYGIDAQRLLRIDHANLDALPHFYRQFIEWCGQQSIESWNLWRDLRAQLIIFVSAGGEITRVSENTATLASALLLLRQFLESTFRADDPTLVDAWIAYIMDYIARLPAFVQQQRQRIFANRQDGVALAEIARGLREGEIFLTPASSAVDMHGKNGGLGWWDRDYIYLRPEETARWVSGQLVRARRISVPMSARALSAALQMRGGNNGIRTQKTFAGRRAWVWPIDRNQLGLEWDGVLEP